MSNFAHAQAACNIDSDKDFLHSKIAEKDHPMLTFYYSSLCQPGRVDLSDVTLPDQASPQATALYYLDYAI